MNKIVSFILGAGIGSVTTYFIVKKTIQERADEEIESVVTTFKERYDKVEKILTDEQKEEVGIYIPEKKELSIPVKDLNLTGEPYKEKVEDLGYSVGVDLSENNDKHVDNITQIDDVKTGMAPYTISEEEFGEFGNEEMTLILYADGTLADDQDEIIDDPESLLGNCLDEFSEYDDALYVRNESKEIDFVILRSDKTFDDINPEVVN